MKKLNFKKITIARLSNNDQSKIKGGWTGGCTDGCTGTTFTGTHWNCTNAACTADCSLGGGLCVTQTCPPGPKG